MHSATWFSISRLAGLLSVVLAAGPLAPAMPTVTNLNGDVLNYQENQDQNISPALVDVGGNAAINMGFIAGKDKFQFQFVGGNSAEDSFYFGNYGTGAGQVIVGLMDDGTGSLRNCVKVSGGIVGSWDPSTNTIVFTSTYANNDTINTLVRNLRYSNSAQYTPSTATRTVRLSFTDWVNETYNATTTIKRSEFGVNYMVPNIPDEMTINLFVEGVRK